jgi:isochorismate synthase
MADSVPACLATQSETDYFSFLIDQAFKHNFSAALWKLPNDPAKHLILSKKAEVLNGTAPLEELATGFIFAPFNALADRFFLKAVYSFSFSNKTLNAPSTPFEVQSHAWLDSLLAGAGTQVVTPTFYFSPKRDSYAADRDFYCNLVSRSVEQIQAGLFEKVVLSRAMHIRISEHFDLPATFQKLCDQYPNALISFVTTPETGSWLGASPELLVCVEDDNTFKTTALAGTLPYTEGINLKAVAWTQKDIEEQALVERYIISCFKKIRLREYNEHGPKTVVAGNLMHLKSDFTVDMKATNFPQLGSVMLHLLHPTSAVCGMPLDTALEFLNKYEGYPREFYAGYLGPVNFLGDTNLFVNLRCMQFTQEGAMLYAGAGITEDSIPEKEWEETELKLNTLLKVIDYT